MDDRHRFRLLHPHVDGDTGNEGWDTYHEWVVDHRTAPVHRDAIGRRNNGTWYRWGRMVCNQSECPGEALFRTDLVEQEAGRWPAGQPVRSEAPGEAGQR